MSVYFTVLDLDLDLGDEARGIWCRCYGNKGFDGASEGFGNMAF